MALVPVIYFSCEYYSIFGCLYILYSFFSFGGGDNPMPRSFDSGGVMRRKQKSEKISKVNKNKNEKERRSVNDNDNDGDEECL